MTRWGATALTTLAVVLALGGSGWPQTSESSVAEALRVEWHRAKERSGIEGYVYNNSSYSIGFVRLRVATQDAAGNQPGAQLAWVYGNVPSRGRWGFSVRIPKELEVQTVTIESFKLIARDYTAESP